MKDQYVKNTQLKTIKKDWPGNRIIDNCFVELCDSKKNNWHGIKLMFKALVLPLFHRNKKFAKADTIHDFVFDRKNDFIIWLGHSSFFIRLNGISIITDPSFYDIPLLKRAVKLPFNLSKLGKIDYLLVSHLHADHVTKTSLDHVMALSPNAKILTGLRLEKYFKKYSNKTQSAGWYQQYDTKKDVDIFYLPAMHNSGTNLFNMNKSLWGSFVIKTPKKVVFFSGDTGYTNHFKEIKKLFPKIDCALIELSWAEKIFIDGKFINGHLYPMHLKGVFTALNPKMTIPMHYGTFYKYMKSIPIETFQGSAKKAGFRQKTKIPKIGEKVIL